MAKKFVRGITDIKNIEHQDFDTNNVNDLLSDGKNNFIHRKKQDGSEEYHNLTNNLKTIQSDDTDLLTVTNYNNTNNSATIRPKHDSQKEQLLESTDETIVISHGENGTEETTSVDVNPEIVLEHENLLTNYGLSKTTSENTTTLEIEYTNIEDAFDLNNLVNGRVSSNKFINSPQPNRFLLVEGYQIGDYKIQHAVLLTDPTNKNFTRFYSGTSWTAWREQVGDKSVIDELLAQKEQVLESTNETILITHGENGTDETTSVDVNPQEVLLHDNLLTGASITKVHDPETNTTTIGVSTSYTNRVEALESGLSTANEAIDALEAQKEQVLESSDGTILISHGENATDETTNVDVNPKKVLTYDNLDMGYGMYKSKSGNTIQLSLAYTSIDRPFDLNYFPIGNAKSDDFINAPKANTFFFVSACSNGNYIFQEAVEENDKNTTYRRTRNQSGVWGEWREQVTDKADIQSMIEQAIQQAMSTNAQTNVEKEEKE